MISILFFLACCAVNTYVLAYEDDPFAPTVEPPEKIENREMWLNMIKKWKVPDKGTVGIPAYPGACIIHVQGHSTMRVNNKKIRTLPVITLATVDQPEKVVSFYKENLKGWNYSNDYMSHAFWKEDGHFDPLDIRKTSIIPNLIIYDVSEDMPEVLIPDARSRIKIVYEPKESLKDKG